MSNFMYATTCGGRAVVNSHHQKASGMKYASGTVDLTNANGQDIASYFYDANVCDEPSVHGIRNGRVSMLMLCPTAMRHSDDPAVAFYDGGWHTVPPPMSTASLAVEAILLHYSEKAEGGTMLKRILKVWE